MDCHLEYLVCCTIQDAAQEKPPVLKKSFSRIQSAKSGVSNMRHNSHSNLKKSDEMKRTQGAYSTQKIQSSKKESIEAKPIPTGSAPAEPSAPEIMPEKVL